MNTSSEFLSFERANFDPETGRMRKPGLVVGVEYDTLGEIDRRNGWSEADEPNEEVHDALRAVAAKGLRELVHFCFPLCLTKTGEGAPQMVARFLSAVAALHPEFMTIGKALRGRIVDSRQLTTAEVAEVAGVTLSEFKKLQQEFFKRLGFRVRVTKRRRKS
jgi:hypothetical protein